MHDPQESNQGFGVRFGTENAPVVTDKVTFKEGLKKSWEGQEELQKADLPNS